MIRISDAAQAHFAKLLANQEEGTQIRVFVINPGTPNAECGVSYCPPDAVEDTDTALKFEQLTAYVDELSAPYLEDAEIDFVTDQLGSQLTLKAPKCAKSLTMPLCWSESSTCCSRRLTRSWQATAAAYR